MKCYKILEKTGNVVGAKAVNEDNDVMIITNEGVIIRMAVSGISKLGRITSGVKLINMDMDKDIYVASLAKVREGSNNITEEAMLKQMEQEMQEENIPVEIASEAEEETDDETVDSSEDIANKEAFEEASKEEDLSDLEELVERALKDRDDTGETE